MTTEAYELDRERGHACGSWVIDGNTSAETCRAIVQGYDDGDPVILDMQPCPLSGEWSGESIPELSDQYGIDLTDDDVTTEFKEGFSDGFWSEVIRAARYQL